MNTKLLLALFLATVSVMAVPQVYAQQPQPLVGTCLSDSQCDIVTLTNGTLMDNPYNPSLLITKAPIPQAEACTGNCPLAAIEEAQTQTQPQIQEEIETTTTVTEEDSGEDEGAADSGRPPSDNPYCDVVRQTGEPYEACFDRKDYSDVTGLYPCRDGSNVEDWRDCPDGPEANSNSNSNSGSEYDDEEPADDVGSDDLLQDGGCQGEDDYCDADENCRSERVDCIDDRNFDEDDYDG